MTKHIPGVFLLDDTKLPDYKSHFEPYHLTPIQASADHVINYIEDFIADPTTGQPDPTPTANQSLVNAAYKGDIGCLRYYLNQGFTLDIAPSAGVSLYSAAIATQQISVISFLTELNVNINSNVEGNFIHPLWICCFEGLTGICEILLKNGADANWKDNAGRTAIMVAAQRGQVNIIELLLKYGAEMNQCSKNGDKALHYALFFGHKEAVDFIGKEKQETTEINPSGQFLGSKDFCVAIRGGDANTVAFVKSACNACDTDGNDMTPLMVACFCGNMDIIKYFMENGACLGTQNKYLMTSFLYACSCQTYEVGQYLCGHQGNTEQFGCFDRDGNSPLILAATSGNLDLVNMLIPHTDINKQNNDGTTALMASSKQGHAEVVKLLLTNMAKTDIMNKNNMTALTLAYVYQHNLVVEAFSHFGITLDSQKMAMEIKLLLAVHRREYVLVKDLIQAGCSVNAASNLGETPLMIASYHGDYDMMRLLLQTGSQVQARNVQGCGVMEYAVDSNTIASVDLLLGYGAALTDSDEAGKNLLHRIVLTGSLEMVKRVLNLGVPIDLTDDNGNTALLLAVQNGYVDIALMLVLHGVDITIKNRDSLCALDYAFTRNEEILITALKQRSEVNGNDLQTAQKLLFLCQQENVPVMEKLLNHNHQSVNCCDSENKYMTSFCSAIADGKLDIVKLLYKYGAHVNSVYQDRPDFPTALHIAVNNDNTDVLKWLATCNVHLNSVDIQGRTALIDAVYVNKYKAAKILIGAGALLNAREHHGYSALTVSVIEHNHDMMELLLKSKAFVDTTDNKGNSPLIIASATNDLCCVTRLLEYGASVNLANNDGITASIGASKNGYLETLKYLKNSGADLSLYTNMGHAAKHFALANDHDEIAEWIDCQIISRSAEALSGNRHVHTETNVRASEQSEESQTISIRESENHQNEHATHIGCSDELEKKDAETKSSFGFEKGVVDDTHTLNTIHMINKQKQSLLSVVRNPWTCSSKSLVSEAIQSGVSVNEENENGQTPLFVAVKNGNYEMVDCLLQCSTNVHHKDKQDQTVLHLCCQVDTPSQLVIAERLCSAGARCNSKDNSGISPLDICIGLGNIGVAKLLLEHGAIVDDCSFELFAYVGNIAHLEPLQLLLKYGKSSAFEEKLHCSLQCGMACSHVDVVCFILTHWRHVKSRNETANTIAALNLWDLDLSYEDRTNCGERNTMVVNKAIVKDFNKMTGLLVTSEEKAQHQNKQTAIMLALKWGQYEVVQALTPCSLLIVNDVQHRVLLPEQERNCNNIVLGYQPLNSGLECEQQIAEIYELSKKLLEKLYHLVLTNYIQSKPESICGISRSWTSSPYIQIHTLEKGQHAAKRFIQELKNTCLPSMQYADVMPVLQESSAFILTGDGVVESMYGVENLCVTGGSKVIVISPQENKKESSILRKGCVGSITGFLRRTNTSNINWFLTSTVECSSDHQDGVVWHHVENTSIISEFIDTDQGTNKMQVGTDYTYVCGVRSCRSICFGICRLANPDLLLQGSCSMGKVTEVFKGEDEDLLSKTVCKTDTATGLTWGMIIDANRSVCCEDGHCYHGTFVVLASNSASSFASSGDAGALVCDSTGTTAIGIVVAAQKNYRHPDGDRLYDHVVFCLRLDCVLEYLQDNFSLELAL